MLFRARSRSNRIEEVVADWWDIHNHILPGLDDGSASMEETLALLHEEHAQGVRHIIFTPHYRPRMFTVSATERLQTYRQVKDYVQTRFPDMTFHLGCEVHIHDNLLETLKIPACRMNGGLYVLFEYSTRGTYRALEHAVLEMTVAGYTPILAHAERYRCMYEGPDRPVRIRQAGALIQINAETFLQKKRSPAKQFADRLMQQGLVDFIASDAHDQVYRTVSIAECAHYIKKEYGQESAEKVLRKNQEAIFR